MKPPKDFVFFVDSKIEMDPHKFKAEVGIILNGTYITIYAFRWWLPLVLPVAGRFLNRE